MYINIYIELSRNRYIFINICIDFIHEWKKQENSELSLIDLWQSPSTTAKKYKGNTGNSGNSNGLGTLICIFMHMYVYVYVYLYVNIYVFLEHTLYHCQEIRESGKIKWFR
jgi:hypothetical protein